jgi:hypothetical protein
LSADAFSCVLARLDEPPDSAMQIPI